MKIIERVGILMHMYAVRAVKVERVGRRLLLNIGVQATCAELPDDSRPYKSCQKRQDVSQHATLYFVHHIFACESYDGSITLHACARPHIAE